MCKITAATLAADGQVVGQALENLATAIQPTDPTVATSLNTAGVAVIDATANWHTGSTLADVEDAEQAAIVVLNSIPLTSPWAALAAIAFTAINLLIANSQTQTTQTGNVVTDAHALLVKANTLNTDSPWFGKAQIHHDILRSPRKDIEAAWNSAATPLGVKTVTV
jgi:hypothetical protein